MTHKPITTGQFIGWAVLVTLGFAFLVITKGRPAVAFTFPLLIASFVIMPSEVRNQPVSPRRLLVVLSGLSAMAAFIGWHVTHPTPQEDDAWARSLFYSCSQPTLAVPLWLLCLYLGYRRWRMKPPHRETAPHDHKPPQPR